MLCVTLHGSLSYARTSVTQVACNESYKDVTDGTYKHTIVQGNVPGYLQVPQDAAVTFETAPTLEVPIVSFIKPQHPCAALARPLL